MKKSRPQQDIQVCHKLTEDNMDRELRGVKEAMAALKLEKGLIVTMGQEDRFENVKVTPAWKWLTLHYYLGTYLTDMSHLSPGHQTPLLFFREEVI